MELRDIMTKDVQKVDRNTPVSQAAQMMKQYNVGSLPVCDNDKVIGIVTDRDIVLRGIAPDGNASNVTCGQLMTENPVFGSPDMDVNVAAKIMAENQIRRLPVVDNGKLAGMVALGDIASKSNLVDEAGDALNDISKPSRPEL
ncbi:MAG TPA: CBS domain-containing protein [Clostridiaceae bacterium]|nr:CBS domain-containing protein [Clostridiaceae bacterium]